jgi:serine/threonine protein kinase
MKMAVNLEGSDDDLRKLLLLQNVVPAAELEQAMSEQRAAAGKGGAVEPLRKLLVRKGLVSSGMFEILRVTTKAVRNCAACGTVHTIYFHHPDSVYTCGYCHVPLSPESLVKSPPASSGPDLSATILPLPDAGLTMLDMGPSRSFLPPSPPSAEQKAAAAKAAGLFDPTLSIVPLPDAGQTMLDMGSSRPASAKKEDAPPSPKAAAPFDAGMSVVPLPDAGQTMLDMGSSRPNNPAQSGGTSKPMDPNTSETDVGTIMLGNTPVPSKAPGKSAKSTDQTVEASRQGKGPGTESTASASKNATVQKSGTVGQVTATVRATPKGHTAGTGGSGGGGQKAQPPEVIEAIKNPDRVFGKYVLLNELGRGGAGVVYKAWDSPLQQYVALKFIRNQDSTDHDSTSGSSQIEEFQKEARMSVRLRHPNIVRIYELGSMSNRYYLAMEYIEGGSLLEFIHGGKEKNQKTRFNSDPLKFLKIMLSIAQAVDYAHNTKPPIIHRDLKPHNVLVDKTGNPYVVDFGLAKEVEVGDNQTLTGVVKGTPTYMAPEQAEGRNREIDARTDVYSLGAILYEMLTGRPPYLGESVPEILRKIATELPERPNEVIARNSLADAASTTRNSKTKTKPLLVPKPLETICLKALEKNRNDRYQTAKELADDIDRYLKDEDILAQEPGLWRRIRRKVRQHPILTGAAAALLLAVITSTVVGNLVKKPDNTADLQKIVTDIADRGNQALQEKNWVALKGAADDLRKQNASDARLVNFDKALKEHEELVFRTRMEWKSDVDRIKREPLKKVLVDLRPKFGRCPELAPELREALRVELAQLLSRLVAESRRLVGTGARPAWVEDFLKEGARETMEQLQTLASLAKDPELPYPLEPSLEEARVGLNQVIAYQGTWTLQVNVAPFAEVALHRADKELAADYTPLGLQDLEVVGSSYVVELYWPSRANPKVTLKEEVKDLHHGQTVVIRGDISKSTLKQERK